MIIFLVEFSVSAGCQCISSDLESCDYEEAECNTQHEFVARYSFVKGQGKSDSFSSREKALEDVKRILRLVNNVSKRLYNSVALYSFCSKQSSRLSVPSGNVHIPEEHSPDSYQQSSASTFNCAANFADNRKP